MQFTAAQTVKYEHIALVERLDGDIERMRAQNSEQAKEIGRLHRIEVEHAELRHANKSKRIIPATCAAAVAIGSIMSRYFATGNYTALSSAGLAMAILASIVQLVIACSDS